VATPVDLAAARVIVIPGSKNTIADLRWLRSTGLADAIVKAAHRGRLVIGLCGGYQILGERVADPKGVAGDSGVAPGLGLLPVQTVFVKRKLVRQVTVECPSRQWTAYEIHMGRTEFTRPVEGLNVVREGDRRRGEGIREGNVWGTYLHGWFEAPEVRQRVAVAAGLANYHPDLVPWAEQRQRIYAQMADQLVASVDLDSVRRYLEI
jgi:adenosylcobyric acid synthase